MEQRRPAAAAVLGPVVRQVAALAQGREIALVVVTRIMIEVRAGQHDAGGRQHRLTGQFGQAQLPRHALRRCQPAHAPAAIVAPAAPLLVIPAPVAQMPHPCAMRPAAMLTAPLGTLETDKGRKLAPVDRVEPAMVRTDRHGYDSESIGAGTKEENHRAQNQATTRFTCGELARGASSPAGFVTI